LPAADCRIEWNHGGMERNTAEIWQKVERMIEEMAASVMRDTQEHMEQLWTQLASPAEAEIKATEEKPNDIPEQPKKE